ncbi:MAG: hypothetical protein MJ082_05275, partial [Clostridia bacterium]|nr:hypothetical protein [Clostridia bacterium]
DVCGKCQSVWSVKDEFDIPLNEGEPAEYAVSMPDQFHILYETERKKSHLLRVRYRVGENR